MDYRLGVQNTGAVLAVSKIPVVRRLVSLHLSYSASAKAISGWWREKTDVRIKHFLLVVPHIYLITRFPKSKWLSDRVYNCRSGIETANKISYLSPIAKYKRPQTKGRYLLWPGTESVHPSSCLPDTSALIGRDVPWGLQ